MSRHTTAGRIARYAVTIPAAGSPVSVYSLLVAAGLPNVQHTGRLASGAEGSFVLGFRIPGTVAGGTDRGAFVIASPRYNSNGDAQDITSTDFSTHGFTSPAGTDYYEPADGDTESYVQSTTASPVPALIIVYLT